MRGIIVHLFWHAILGVVVTVFLWWVTGSIWWGAAGGAVNVLMDIDHLLEYLFFWRRFRWREFLDGSHFRKNKKIVIIFHGWEYVILSFLLWLWWQKNIFLILFVGLGAHLFFDQLSWNLYPFSYFFLYRLKYGFAISRVCRDEYG